MIYLNDNLERFDVEAALPLLSEERRKQVLRYRYELGRKQSAAAYLLLCRALQQEYGIKKAPVFEYGEHGKPLITGCPDIHFNLSHCREAVLCAVSDRPVGVDVESIGRYKESLARYTMNDNEMAQIAAADSHDVAFIRLWTQKEAVLKLSGEGLRNDLKQVLVGFSGRLSTTVNEEKGYVYSVATP